MVKLTIFGGERERELGDVHGDPLRLINGSSFEQWVHPSTWFHQISQQRRNVPYLGLNPRGLAVGIGPRVGPENDWRKHESFRWYASDAHIRGCYMWGFLKMGYPPKMAGLLL